MAAVKGTTGAYKTTHSLFFRKEKRMYANDFNTRGKVKGELRVGQGWDGVVSL